MSSIKLPGSKLPQEQESIFSTMSKMAADHQAIDLSQGFPNFETDALLKELVARAMKAGYNQYAPLAGVPELRMAIAGKIYKLHGHLYDQDTEVTVTNGATQALYNSITAFVDKGDEVIVFKPAYDSYEPAIKLNGGTPVPVQLKGPDFKIDWELLKEKISERTRMLIINTPHNPSGKVLSREDMSRLESLLEGTDIILLSDEVYEHIVFDGLKHQSASAFPGLVERSIVCASFGKTFHNTGWKMGYCVGPADLMKEIRTVHGLNVFCVNHPMQRAFAEYLKDPVHYLPLGDFYQQKRDLFLSLIEGSRFKQQPSQGTYFQLLDFSEITDEPDVDFARRLITEHKLASIPVSVFNLNRKDHQQLRFCFAKTDDTLKKAAEILNSL